MVVPILENINARGGMLVLVWYSATGVAVYTLVCS